MEIPQAYGKTADWVENIVSNVSPEQYDSPTPCAKWSVKELLNHIIGGPYFFATVLKHESLPEGDTPDLVGDDPAGAYRAAADGYLAVLSEPSALEGTVNPPFGETPADVFAGIAFMDQVAHGWDLATATGQDTAIPADLVPMADGLARQVVSNLPRTPDLFDEEVTVGDGASAQERFIAFLGRTP